MADEQGDEGTGRKEPSLELPTLRLPASGRRTKRRRSSGKRAADRAGTGTDAAALPSARREAPPAPAPELAKRRAAKSATPSLPAQVASALAGLTVGVVGVAATFVGMQGCEVVTGTDSCGGAPGFLVLVAILVLMVLLGSVLLRAWRVSDPGSTSLLAVGLVTVVVLVALLEVIFSAWMFAVVPALTATSYALARWVTTRFAEEPERPEAHDVR